MRARRSAVLAAAFAAMLVIIGLSSFAIWRNAATTQARIASLYQADNNTSDALASIRANVYLAAILTRDYLLDPDPGHSHQYADQFLKMRTKTVDSFTVIAAAVKTPRERATLDRLREDIETHLDPTRIILGWTPDERRLRARAFLQERLRRREEIVALAAQVDQALSEQYAAERVSAGQANQDFRTSLAWTSGLALFLGLAIAAVTLQRMNALEQRSRTAESELRRLSAQVRAAQENERKNLSRELHDEVGQMLTGLRMELAGISRLDGNADSEIGVRIARSKGIVEKILGIVRNISMLLRPSMLDDLGLTPALEWLAKQISQSCGMEIQTDVELKLDLLPDAQRTCLYRVAQEAFTNISKHANAHSARMSLSILGNSVIGTIADDGGGFEAGAVERGLGLAGMEERLRELGGQLRVISSVGRGTRLEFHLPIPTTEEDTSEEMHDSHLNRGRSRHRADRVETSP